MWKKLVGVSIIGGISLNSLYQKDWNINRIGVVRLGRVAVTTGLIAYDYKKIIKNKQLYEDLEAWSKVHTNAATKLLNMCTKNGGVYIKVGQHIATLRYLIPNEYCDVLKVLHSKAPVSSIEDVKKILQEDLKKPFEDLFIEFDEKPLGTASLAQVHRAKLKENGKEIAVKIQHPDVKNNSNVDMITMDFFFNLVDRTFPEFSMKWLAEEMRINLPLELDFLNEGKNCERIREMFKKFSWFKTPDIYWKFSTHRVLTMELMEGEEITNVNYIKQEKINPNLITDRLTTIFSEMIFVNGYVHCDPHPGNILVKQTDNGPDIILLDHGLYTTLPNEFRHNYSNLWLSLINNDQKATEKWSQKLNCGELYRIFLCILTAKPWDTVSTGLIKSAKTKKDGQDSKELKKHAAKHLPDIVHVLRKVPRELLLILKTNDLIRGIQHQLDTKDQLSCFLTMSKCCIRSIYDERIRNSNFWQKIYFLVAKNLVLLKVSVLGFLFA